MPPDTAFFTLLLRPVELNFPGIPFDVVFPALPLFELGLPVTCFPVSGLFVVGLPVVSFSFDGRLPVVGFSFDGLPVVDFPVDGRLFLDVVLLEVLPVDLSVVFLFLLS